MNRLIYFLLFFTLNGTQIYGQCELNNTHTDWRTQYVQPSSSGFKTNSFDWTMDPVTPIGKDNIDISLTSPYWENEQINLESLAKGTLSDYSPEDGWELIKQDLGYFAGSSVVWNNAQIGTTYEDIDVAYILLYNKYQAKLRIFAIAVNSGQTSAQALKIKLSFSDATGDVIDSRTTVSALFNSYNQIEQTLDQNTNMLQVEAICSAPAWTNEWTYADFPMAYDPCTCHFQTGIKVDFSFVTSGNIQASGAGLSVAVPQTFLSKTGTTLDQLMGADMSASGDPYNFSGNFTGVNTSPLNSLVLAYKDESTLASNTLSTTQLKDVQNTLAIAALVSKTSADAYASLNRNTIATDIGDGLGELSDVFNFFTAKTSASVDPYPLVISSQLAFQGTDIITSPCCYFHVANPGSLDANTAPEYSSFDLTNNRDEYPMYNNPMGLFALSKAMTVDQAKNDVSAGIGFDDATEGGEHAFTFTDGFTYEYQLESDQFFYTLNPIVDPDKTIITGALEIEGMPDNSKFSSEEVNNLVYKFIDQNGFNVWRTRFFPIECLPEMVAQDKYTLTTVVHDDSPSEADARTALITSTNAVSVNLILSIMYVFYADEYGNVHTSLQELKYPLTINRVCTDNSSCMLSTSTANSTVFSEISSIPKDLAIHAQTFTTSQTINSWGTITIDGDLGNSSGGIVQIIASDAIDLEPGAQIEPNINLMIVPFFSLCNGLSPIAPTAVSYDDCTSGFYKASAASKKDDPQSYHTNANKGFNALIYPNPTTGNVSVTASGLTNNSTGISITNTIGEMVYQQNLGSNNNTNMKWQLNNLNLADGLYLVKIQNGSNSETHKLVINKN